MHKYAVVINQKYYPSVEYFPTLEAARAEWRKAIEYQSGMPCAIHVVEIIDSIALEDPIIDGWEK